MHRVLSEGLALMSQPVLIGVLLYETVRLVLGSQVNLYEEVAECPSCFLYLSTCEIAFLSSRSTMETVDTTYFAGLNVAHLMASPNEHPVNLEKSRTHLSIVKTLRTLKRVITSIAAM